MSDLAPTPVPVRLAATVLLVRNTPQFEVLMVKRHHQIDFASGALVFPGGKIEAADADPAWEAHGLGWADHAPQIRALKIAAVREAFEESGVLLARERDGSAWKASEAAAACREKIAKGEMAFLDLVKSLGVVLDLGGMTTFARWITPKGMPKRFDTYFYIAVAPADQLAVCDGWETVDAEWIAPQEALDLAVKGERKIIFPTRMNLQLLAESQDAASAIAAARARPEVLVEPVVERRNGETVLVLPPDAGYGAVVELFSDAT